MEGHSEGQSEGRGEVRRDRRRERGKGILVKMLRRIRRMAETLLDHST